MEIRSKKLFTKSLPFFIIVGSFFLFISPTLAGNVYFSDQFDVSSQTELSARTPDVGTSWSQLINNGRNLYVQTYNDWITTQSNGSNVGTLYQANATYSSADYQITGRSAFSGGDSNYTRSYAIRIQDANNMYLARFGYGASGVIIYKRTSGTWSQLGSTSYTPVDDLSAPYNDAGDIIGIRAQGTSISALVNGVEVLTVTDSDHSTAGVAGVGTGYVNISTDDSGTGVGIDNIIVEDLVDTTAPTVSYFNPADNATGVAVDAIFEINFSEAIVTSTGNIILYKTSDDSVVETIDITDTSGLVTASSTTALLINPATTLESETEYYFTIASTAIDDSVGNSFVGITASTTWSFTTADVINPTVSYFSPTDNATGLAVDVNFEINFNEDITTSTGNIILYKASDDSIVETIDIADQTGLITASSTTSIIINPTSDLDSATEYYFTIASTAFDDTSGNSYAGISDSTTWSFTTVDTVAPTISGASPSGEQSAGTSSATLSANTDENATCKYSTTSGDSFASMTSFSTTGGTSHSSSVSVSDGTSYTYYVLCQDASSNESAQTTISFSVASATSNVNGPTVIRPAPTIGHGGDSHFVKMGESKNIGKINNKASNIATYIHSHVTFQTIVSNSGKSKTESHQLEIIDFDLFYKIVTLKINSETQIVKLNLEDTKKLDLDNDGQNDIEIKFVDVVTNRAELTISNIEEVEQVDEKIEITEEIKKEVEVNEIANKTKTIERTIPIEKESDNTPAILKNSEYTFHKDLEKGLFDEEVRELQKYLNNNGFVINQTGFGSPGEETTFFGSLTEKALINFQKSHGLPSYGFFGPITRAIINN